MDDGCDRNRAVVLFESSLNPVNQFISNLYETQDDAEKKSNAKGTDRFGIHGKRLNGLFFFETSDCYPYVLEK